MLSWCLKKLDSQAYVLFVDRGSISQQISYNFLLNHLQIKNDATTVKSMSAWRFSSAAAALILAGARSKICGPATATKKKKSRYHWVLLFFQAVQSDNALEGAQSLTYG